MLDLGQTFRLINPSLQIKLQALNLNERGAKIEILTGERKISKNLKTDQSISFELVFNTSSQLIFLKLVDVTSSTCRISVLNGQAPVASLESKRVGAQRFSGSDKLGSGIQTIEKAKQTSLVAIDFDLQYNEQILVKTSTDNQRKLKSFALLGNGVHWTDHDLSVLETYVDYTFQVKDTAIVRYADYVKNLAKEEKLPFFDFFMAYFSGMTATPEDDFRVTEQDFLQLRPLGRESHKALLELVRLQVPAYNVLT